MKEGIAAFFLSLSLTALSVAEELPAVLSLDYCADQYVLALADREQITALSKESRMVHSFHRERAKGLPQTGMSVEEVLLYTPDVVVSTWGGDARLFSVLEAQGTQVVRVTYEDNLEKVSANIRRVGDEMGQGPRAEARALDLEARWKRLKAAPPLPHVAIYLTPGSVTAGRGTTVNAILKLAGLKTYGEEKDFNGWVDFPMEQVVLDPPDLFVTGFYDQPGTTVAHWNLARHQTVRHWLSSAPRVDVPARYLSCNSLFLVEAAEYIRREVGAP